MATVYHRDQAGAPSLTYGSTSAVGFNAFKTVLKAALVYGYGALPAAGWELINEGSDFLVLRNGQHSGYVCFSLAGEMARVYLAETYTGMAGNVMTGAGVKSGTASGAAVPHCVTVRYLVPSSSNSTWVVVADDRTFVLAMYGHSNSTNVLMSELASAGGLATVCVGEDSAGHFVAVGGASSADSGSTWFNTPALRTDSGFTSLKDPATGLLLNSAPLRMRIPAVPYTPNTTDATTTLQVADIAALPEVSLVPIHWQGGGVVAGRLRGIALCPDVQGLTLPNIAAQCLGRPTPMYVRDGNQSLDLGDSYSYFVRAGDYRSIFWLITDNPGFW